MKIVSLTKNISLRRPLEMGNMEQLKTVKGVLADVQSRGDEAIAEYSEKWDGVKLEKFRVSQDEINNAKEHLSHAQTPLTARPD